MKIAMLITKSMGEKLFSEKYLERLRRSGDLVIYDREKFDDEAYTLDFVRGADAIITSWGSPAISEAILAVCPNLAVVFHAAGSAKTVITPAFIERKIRITNSAAAIGEGVAETALALAITACKGVYPLAESTAAGEWNEKRGCVKDFYDIKVGVISGGYVGRHMVKLLSAFHVDIVMYDPTLTAEQIREIGAEKVDLDTLMAECDVVSIHAPAIPATQNMLHKDNLALMKDGAILINTARGSIVNEADLIAELERGRIFACIDVTEPEPPTKENRLRTLPNVVLTPHIAGTVSNGFKRIALHVSEELERFLAGERMRTEINLDDLDKLA